MIVYFKVEIVKIYFYISTSSLNCEKNLINYFAKKYG